MRLLSLLCTALLAGAACNPDSGLTVHDPNQPPEVTLLAPADGEQFVEGDVIEVAARIHDDFTPLEHLELSWRTTNGGQLAGTAERDQDTATLVVEDLAPGDHGISVTVVDEQGASSRAEVALTVEANRAPEPSFVAPAPGERFALGTEVMVVVDIADDFDDPGDLHLAWSGAAAGIAEAPAAPDGNGEARLELTGLGEGGHEVVVTATDSRGASRSASVDFELVDPDGDGDGFVSEAFGGLDCDDENAAIHPDATEVCDGDDNDCSGAVDDDAVDATTWYHDYDLDGFGDPDDTQQHCDTPGGRWVDQAGDCDDGDPDVNPLETEICGNDIDDDCANGVDDGCAVDYSGTWYLYEPGTDTRLTVSYACDGWSFAFDTVTIDDTWPSIEVTAGPLSTRVNGCEPGFESTCGDSDGMPGAYAADSTTDWTAEDAIEPLLGMGYAEIYEWLDTTGTAGTHASFTGPDTFTGSFAWSFEARSQPPPDDCKAGFVEVEGRRQ